MEKWEIENHIKSAIETMTPDVYEKVFSADILKEKKEDYKKTTREKKNKWLYAVGTIAACLFLVIGFQIQMNQVISIIEIDVNPSIEIQVNKDDKVVNVIPNNQDGVLVLEDMDLKHMDINVASNAVLGSMVKKGYINENNNAILITIKSKKEDREIALGKELAADANSILKENHLNAMVLKQKDPSDKTVERWSEKYDISYGKAAFIYHMIEKDSSWKSDELAVLTIGQLMEMASKSDKVVLSDLVTDSSSYISEQEAADIIKKAYGNVDILDIKLDYENSNPIYIIELKEDGKLYEFFMEAYTGKLLIEKNKQTEQKQEKESKTNRDKKEEKRTDDREKNNIKSKADLTNETKQDKRKEKNTQKQENETKKEVAITKNKQPPKQKEPTKEETKKPAAEKTPMPVAVNKDEEDEEDKEEEIEEDEKEADDEDEEENESQDRDEDEDDEDDEEQEEDEDDK